MITSGSSLVLRTETQAVRGESPINAELREIIDYVNNPQTPISAAQNAIQRLIVDVRESQMGVVITKHRRDWGNIAFSVVCLSLVGGFSYLSYGVANSSTISSSAKKMIIVFTAFFAAVAAYSFYYFCRNSREVIVESEVMVRDSTPVRGTFIPDGYIGDQTSVVVQPMDDLERSLLRSRPTIN